MTLGENLQRLRREKNLSQEEVARQLFVSQQSVSKWENNIAEPGVENLKALARLYEVTLDRLLGEQQEAKELSPEEDHYAAVLAVRTVAMFAVWIITIFYAIYFWFEGAGAFILCLFSLTMGWLAVLAGNWIRQPTVWVAAIMLELFDLALGLVCFNVENKEGNFLGGGSAILIGGLTLILLFQKKTRNYFNQR